MRRACYIFASLIPIAVVIIAVSLGFIKAPGARATASAAVCTPTGFMRDGIDLTAAVIDPVGTYSGTLDATGCNIGIYYSSGITAAVNNAEIFGANYFGIVNNGGNVTISNSRIHDIGESPFNGDQHGVGIYFADGSSAKGSITSNSVYRYQKGGIVVNGVGSSATIKHNSVLGLGPVNFIAQNGIEVGDGAQASVINNAVTGNSYTGSEGVSSGGILVFGGSCYASALTVKTSISKNILIGNDVGVFLSNLDVDPNNPNNCLPTTTATKITTSQNTIRNDSVNNTSGFGSPGSGYQAGVSDQGDFDQISANKICGKGYTPVPTPPPYLYRIDVTATNHAIVHSNTSCSKGDSTSSQAQTTTLRSEKQAAVFR